MKRKYFCSTHKIIYKDLGFCNECRNEKRCNKILQGDSFEVLKTLESESVDCCITSPPYFGLRDYGTADWEGGAIDCDHKIPKGEFDPKNPESGSHISRFNRKSCFRCGALRKDKQIGLEETPEEYTQRLVELFSEVKRVLKKEGTLWLNLGDSYAGNTSRASNGGRAGFGTKREGVFTKGGGLEGKQLMGIPWRVAFALQADGWYLRQDIIWAKPNPMPESVKDRCTKSHEYIFLLSKSKDYFFDNEAIKEETLTQDSTIRDRDNTRLNNTPGRSTMGGLKTNNYEMRNKRDVWTVATKPYAEAHFATFPETLIEPMVLAGCPENGVVLDVFMGAGTTAIVSKKLKRNYLGIELNPKYIEIAERRIQGTTPPLL